MSHFVLDERAFQEAEAQNISVVQVLLNLQTQYQKGTLPKSSKTPSMPRFGKMTEYSTGGKPGIHGIRLCTTDSSRHNGPVCPVCGAINDLKACGRCTKVYYCDSECQRYHWPQHKPACVPLVSNVPNDTIDE